MDPLTLATTVTTLLAPFIKKAGVAAIDKLAEMLKEKSPSLAKIWEAISNSSSSERVTVAAKDFADDTDPDNAEILQQQLTTALQLTLKKDEELARQIAELMDKAKSETGINIGGDGVVATNHSNAIKGDINAAGAKINSKGNVNFGHTQKS